MRNQGSISRNNTEDFVFSKTRWPLWGPETSLPMDTSFFTPELKFLERERGYTPLSSDEVKNAWIYTTKPLYAFV
jgi:hypothetical protein